jgi:hypothetical protein
VLLLYDLNRSNDLNRGDKAIAMPWQCLNELRVLGVITQGPAQFLDGSVSTVFKVNEGVGRPELLLELLPRYHFTRPVKEDGENLEG